MFACPGIVLSSISQCSGSAAPFARSATPVSRGAARAWSWRRYMSVHFVRPSLRVSVVAVSSDLSGGREIGTRHIAPQPTSGGFEEMLTNEKTQINVAYYDM